MLDIVNEDLMAKARNPIAFDHDCREGICGTCSLTINGMPHGPERRRTTCQLYMRKFKDGDTIYIEPFRARPFPVIKDLSSTAPPSIASSRPADSSPRAPAARRTATPSPSRRPRPTPPWKPPPASAAAHVSPPARMPARCSSSARRFPTCLAPARPARTQQRAPRDGRTDGRGRLRQLLELLECEAVCPAEIPISVISRLNREYAMASVKDGVS